MSKNNEIKLPQTAAELEAMGAEEIDAAITGLRRRQKESAPVKFRAVRYFGLRGDAFAGGLSGGTDKWWKEFGIPDIEEDGFAADAKNLRGDMERVGRDMWMGLLQHAKSAKTNPTR